MYLVGQNSSKSIFEVIINRTSKCKLGHTSFHSQKGPDTRYNNTTKSLVLVSAILASITTATRTKGWIPDVCQKVRWNSHPNSEHNHWDYGERAKLMCDFPIKRQDGSLIDELIYHNLIVSDVRCKKNYQKRKSLGSSWTISSLLNYMLHNLTNDRYGSLRCQTRT